MKTFNLSPVRISRSLVTVLVLTLIQVIGAPILAPDASTNSASAANASLIPGYEIDANATSSSDVTSSMTLVGSPAYTNTASSAGVGYYTFDATSTKYGYVTTRFPTASQNISVFMWVYVTAEGMLLSHSGQTDPYSGYRLSMMDFIGGKFRVGLYNSTGAQYITNTLVSPLQNWYYVGLTYDGTTLRGYLNGVEFTETKNLTWNPAGRNAGYPNDYIHVGSSQGGTCFGTCPTAAASFRMAEFTLYLSRLTEAQVNTNYLNTQSRFAPQATNPTSVSIQTNRTATFSTTCSRVTSANAATACGIQWQEWSTVNSRWDDIAGATTATYTTSIFNTVATGKKYRVRVYDPGSGSPTTAKLYSVSDEATLTISQPPGSDTDTALYFNGSTYVKVADSNEVDFANNFTFEAWVKPEAMTSYGMILNKEDSIEFYISGGYFGIAAQKALNQWGYFQTGVPATVDQWQHIAYTRAANSTTVNVYLNGLLAWSGVIDTDFNGAPLNTSYPLMIGGRSTSGNGALFDPSFKGQIDQVAVFSTVRTQAEIQSDLKSYISPTTTGLQLYYDFNEGTGSTTLYNRKSESTAASDMTLSPTPPTWMDVKEVSTPANSPYTITKFTRTYITVNGGWRAPANISKLSALVVAGGGGGGSRHGGGGGAGGIGYGGGYAVNSNQIYQINVGFGGAGYGNFGNSAYVDASGFLVEFKSGPAGGLGARGENSFFKALSSNTDSITALGGGGGSGSGATGSGGSGGGSNQSIVGGTATQYSGSNWIGYGSAGGQGSAGSCATDWCGGGGGGAGAVGTAARTGTDKPGNGGAGKEFDISGSLLWYAGGGGGGSKDGASVATGGNGGGGNGGNSAIGQNATYATGGGGGGGGFSGSIDYRGGNGGSGVIILRWITAQLPTYTKPSNAYLNVGMTETFTTNVAQDSATAVLTRTFKWESTTPTANGAYTLLKQGTGAANAVFSWIPTDTRTSGSGYLYRLTVTDSDTAGLSISDSSTAYAVINGALVASGLRTITKTVNIGKSETYTITLGTGPYRISWLGTEPKLLLETATATSIRLKVSDTATIGTYYETITVVDSVSAVLIIPLVVNVVAVPSILWEGALVARGLVLDYQIGNSQSLLGTNGVATTGLTLRDLSGRQNDATTGGTFSNVVCAAPTYSSSNGGALSFGSGKCYYTPYNGDDLRNHYTAEVWFKKTGSFGINSYLVSQRLGSADYTSISIGTMGEMDQSLRVGFYYNGLMRSTSCGYIPTLNEWTHIAGTYDGVTLRLYINGQLLCADSNSSLIPDALSNPEGIMIGAAPNAGNIFINAQIGSVRLYGNPLSDYEIADNYHLSKTRFKDGSNYLVSISKKYGSVSQESFTVVSGTDSNTVSFAIGSRSGIIWDSATSISRIKLNLQESSTIGTYLETITVTDANGSATMLPLVIDVTVADSLTVTMDTATTTFYNGSRITAYPRPTIRGLVWQDTATTVSRFSSALYSESALAPINADTYTVRGATPTFTVGSLSNYAGIIYEESTATINKINQRPLQIFMYGGTVGSSYLIWLQGGDGTGDVSETLTGISSLSGCSISNHYLSAQEQKQGFCEVRVVKAGDQNYFAETQTVQMYFMAYINNQPVGQVGSGSTIAINGATSFDTSTVTPPSITSFNLNSAAALTTIEINGSGFSQPGLIIKFNRNKIAATPSSLTDSKITVTIPSGATTGKVVVITQRGEAVSPQSLVITP